MTSLSITGGSGEPLATALDNGIALILRPDLTSDEWLEVGRRLGRGAQGIQWFLGDWLNYGTDKGYILNGKYDLAADLTGMTKDWLYVCAWVARAIEPSDRKAELSFAHHRQVASLKPSLERSALLQVAVEQNISSRDLYRLSNEFASPPADSQLVGSSAIVVAAPDQLTQARALPPVQSGELIELGPHRLIVGDSTDPAVWFKLFNGEALASSMWTDPPYGVSYVGKTSEEMVVDSDTVEDLPRLLALSFVHADKHLRDGSGLYICTGFSNQDIFIQVIRAMEWRFSTELVWIKNHFAMGRGDYHPQHEAQLYAFKGEGRRWYGPQNRSTVFGLGLNEEGVFGYTIPRPSASHRHPTMKPPKLIFEQLRNSMLNGEVVVDPFAGSGATMVAAHQLGVRAFMIELNPQYGAEIVDRWKEINSG